MIGAGFSPGNTAKGNGGDGLYITRGVLGVTGVRDLVSNTSIGDGGYGRQWVNRSPLVEPEITPNRRPVLTTN